jgi:hypothetical protein
VTTDYLLCGLRVRSALPLRELPQWSGSADATVDVTIAEGWVADRLDDPVLPGRFVMVGTDGSVLLHIPDLVRLLVRNGREIRVEILRRDAEEGWRLFLLGAGFHYLCHQRGLFPLHAASLRIGGRIVAVAGHSGSGKSTLAWALTQRGHQLLSDDVTVLRTSPEAPPVTLPAWPRLKLWRDALDRFGIAAADLARVRDGMEKYDLCPQAEIAPAPAPLDGIIMLDKGAEVVLLRQSPMAAVPMVRSFVHRDRVALHLGRKAALFTQAAAIARFVPVWRLVRPMEFDCLDRTVAIIEERLAL